MVGLEELRRYFHDQPFLPIIDYLDSRSCFINLTQISWKESQEEMGFSKGKLIRILSIEDLIVDRLNACKHWKSQYDCEQAQVLAGAYLNKPDME